MSLHRWINLVLLAAVLYVLVRAAIDLLMRDWLTIRRHDQAMASYDLQPGDMDDVVSAALAAVGAEARAGCTCEGCDKIRATTAEAMFRLDADDIAELARHGIAWEVS